MEDPLESQSLARSHPEFTLFPGQFGNLAASLGGQSSLSVTNQYAISTYLNYYKGNNVTNLCMSFETVLSCD